jgi:thiol-disulfide isomerase/thioredoxin
MHRTSTQYVRHIVRCSRRHARTVGGGTQRMPSCLGGQKQPITPSAISHHRKHLRPLTSSPFSIFSTISALSTTLFIFRNVVFSSYATLHPTVVTTTMLRNLIIGNTMLAIVFCSLESMVVVQSFQASVWNPRPQAAAPLWVASTLHLQDPNPPVAIITVFPDVPEVIDYPPPSSMTITTTEAPSSRKRTNSVKLLTTTRDLLNVMQGDASPDKLVVVKFYAHYCKICQRAGIQLKKVAGEYPDIDFCKVECLVIPDTANTLRSLGVTRFPFVQIYRQGQCVASFATGPSHLFVKRIQATLDECQKRTESEWDQFVETLSTEIQSNLGVRTNLSLLP